MSEGLDTPEPVGEISVIQGRYELLGKIGTGSFGDVYEAIDRQLDECRIAIKMLHRTFLTDIQNL